MIPNGEMTSDIGLMYVFKPLPSDQFGKIV